MSPWTWLGIPQEASEAEVRRAYAQTLRRHRPDEDPQGFQTTHEAYRIALHWARRPPDWDDDADDDDVDPVTSTERPDTEAPKPVTETVAVDAPEALDQTDSDLDVPAGDAGRAPATVTPLAEETDASQSEAPTPRAEAGTEPALSSGGDSTVPDTNERFEADAASDTDDYTPTADWAPDVGSRTQPFLPLDFDAPILRRLLETPASALDVERLRGELAAALAGLDTEQRLVISQRVAAAVEGWSEAPPPGVVSVLAELLDWDTVFLRYRPDRIVELLAADEAHAALQARLQHPASLGRPLRALTRPVSLFDPASWPLWLSTRKVWRELMQIQTESPIAVTQLDAGAVALTRALMDHGHLGIARLLRWLAVASVLGLGAILLVLLLDGAAALATSETWVFGGGFAALVLAAAYLRARVLQVYALPLEPARQLWLIALLLGLLLLAGSAPDAMGAPVWLLTSLAAGATIGRHRVVPGILVLGAATMLPAALKPLTGPLPDQWISATLVLITALVLGIDYVVARRSGLTLEEAGQQEKPLYLLGAAIFLALILVGAATEDARKPIPVRPTHSA